MVTFVRKDGDKVLPTNISPTHNKEVGGYAWHVSGTAIFFLRVDLQSNVFVQEIACGKCKTLIRN